MTIGDDENIKKLSDKLRELAQRKTAKERSNLKPTKHQPTIAEMIAEVQASKRFFVEGQLFKLIALGSEKATMFAAERLMPKEYGNKIQHSGSIEHNHTHTQQLDLANLPTEVRGKIFELLMDSGMIDPDGLLAAPTLEAASVKRIT
jgi:hypothetical protein